MPDEDPARVNHVSPRQSTQSTKPPKKSIRPPHLPFPWYKDKQGSPQRRRDLGKGTEAVVAKEGDNQGGGGANSPPYMTSGRNGIGIALSC